MKTIKAVLLSVLALMCGAVPAMAQQSEVLASSEDALGIHPYVDEEDPSLQKTGWSIYFPVGFTFADMDESGGAKLGSGLSDMTMNLGVGLEYSFTPLWSIGGEFQVANYGKNSFQANKNSDGGIRTDADGKPASFGNIYNMSAFLALDFADAFFPHRKHTLVNAYGMIGAGLGFYTFQAQDAGVFSSTKGLKGYNYDPFIQFGLNLEFNVTRQFAIGARVTYNYYMSDNLDYSATSGSAADDKGRINSNNDGLLMADLLFRYNILGTPKSHVRNMTPEFYDGLYAKKEAPKAEAPRQKDTLYIITRDTIVMEKKVESAAPRSVESYFVYFDNDKKNLKPEALATIQRAATRMQEDDNAYAVVIGYCDNTGSQEYNYALADARSANVLEELVTQYDLDERVCGAGRGIIVGRKSAGTSYAPNRRVEIRIVSKAEMIDYCTSLDEEKGGREVRMQGQASLDELMKLSEVAIGSEVTTAETTLNKLARKYYNSSLCWVYIYMANKDKIKNPNLLEKDVILTIPQLNHAQQSLSAEQSIQIYSRLRNKAVRF